MKFKYNYINFILPAIILVLSILIYFINMGSYPFIDTDETKFVAIAKEMLNYNSWVNIKLNGENIFDYSPLFFWITNFSCLIFGKINAVSARLPIAAATTIGIFTLFYVIKSILQKTYAIIISLILALSLGVIVFSRLATNDILSAFLMMQTILFSYLLLFNKNDKYKSLLWCYILFFCGLSVLSAGILGFLIPLFSISAIFIFSGKSRKLLNIHYIYIGIIIFLITVLPWHILMINRHGLSFIKEYIDGYNIIKYTGIKESLSVIGLFLLGFLPWTFSFIWILGTKFKAIINSFISYFKENSEDKLKEKWNKLKQVDKFLSINTIVFFCALIFSVLYGDKYTFLIIFLMFPAACISGYYWYEYLIKKKHDKSIFFATLIPDITLIICSLAGLLGHNILNKWLFNGLNHLVIPLIIIFFIIPLIGIFAVILKGRIIVFLSNIILMISLSFVITPSIYNFICKNGGENDLISYAQIANKEKVTLTAFIPSKKYSLIYYYDNHVNFYNKNNLEGLKEYLKNNPKDFVIVEIKDLWAIEEYGIKYMLLDAGKRYCMIQHMLYDIEKLEDKTEPEIIVY